LGFDEFTKPENLCPLDFVDEQLNKFLRWSVLFSFSFHSSSILFVFALPRQ